MQPWLWEKREACSIKSVLRESPAVHSHLRQGLALQPSTTNHRAGGYQLLEAGAPPTPAAAFTGVKAELVPDGGALHPLKGQETHYRSFSEAAVSFPVGLINI